MTRKHPSLKNRNKPKSEAASDKTRAWSILTVENAGFVVPLICTLFAMLFALISITSFVQKSPTVDEPVHLLAGYANLKWGDYRANPEHPPLAKMWAALPLVFLDINDPRPVSSAWDRIPTASPMALHTVDVAARLFFLDNDGETLFFFAKLMMIALATALGFYVFKWSRELWGLTGALASLFFYALDPNILAHSQLVHTDLPFTALFFIATYFYCRSLDQLNGKNLAFTVLFFGLAAVTKYAYSLILVIWAVLGGIKVFSAQGLDLAIGKQIVVTQRWKKLAVLVGVFACALLSAYMFIWLVYGVRFDAVPGGQLRLPIAQELPKSPAIRALVGFLLEYRLFPEAWIYGQLHIYGNLSRDTYLLGKMLIGEGSWLYFPVAFSVKTPIPTLLLFFGTFAMWFYEHSWRRSACILLGPIAVYFFLAVGSGINIGLRHILPIYPFIFVLIGGTAATLWQAKSRLKNTIIGVLCTWILLSAVLTYPNHLAYFNEFAGGPGNGHRILLDSNLDWGQDLKGLKSWMDRERVGKIQFLYFGFFNAAAPRYYGIDATFLPGSWVAANDVTIDDPTRPDYIAISANLLYGNFFTGIDEGFIKPFRSVTPATTIGHTILVYQFDEVVRHYREFVRGNSASAKSHFYLGNLLIHQGSWQEALEEYRRAVRMDPDFAEAHNKLGIVLVRLGALEEAIPHLRLALKSKHLKRMYETQFQLGAVFAQQGNLQEASRYFQESIETRPEFVPAHYNLGIVSAAQGDMVRAIWHFRETLRLDSENVEAHIALARALAEQNRKDEASKHFQEAIRILKATNPSSSSDRGQP
jgi:Tfp pilus assembly protein PilF